MFMWTMYEGQDFFFYCSSTKAATSAKTLSFWAKSIFADICSKVQGSRGETGAKRTKDGLWRGLTGPGVSISFVRDPVVLEEWEVGEALQAFYLGDTTGDRDE